MKRFLKRLKRLYYDLKRFKDYEEKNKQNISLKNRLKFNLKGFSSANVINYNLTLNSPNNFLSEWQRINKANRINSGHKNLMGNKIIFHSYFKNNPNVIQPLAFIVDGKIIDPISKGHLSLGQFLSEINEDIIFKPSNNDRGEGIKKIDISNENCKNKIYRLLENNVNYVIQKIIKQDGIYNKINPESVNTIRILVMKDTETQEHFIARAVQRFGTKTSDFLDNWSAGGMSVGIELKEGIYKKGVIKQKGELKWVSAHPDTNVCFEGEKIENWDAIKKMVIQASKDFFFIKYIGWDIIPSKNSASILEANHNCNIDLLQTHGGLLGDSKIRKFYKENKVID